MCHLTISLLPFINTDNAAKERTLTDVSVKSNTGDMFSPSEMEDTLEEIITIR